MLRKPFEETIDNFYCFAIRQEQWIEPRGYYKRWITLFIRVPDYLVGRLPRVNTLEGPWKPAWLSYFRRYTQLSRDPGVWIGLDFEIETESEQIKQCCHQFISTLKSNLKPCGSKIYGVLGEVTGTYVDDDADELVWFKAGSTYASIHYTREEAEQAMKKYQDDRDALDARSKTLGYRRSFSRLKVIEFDFLADTYLA